MLLREVALWSEEVSDRDGLLLWEVRVPGISGKTLLKNTHLGAPG